jgi:hypothetical protein
MVRASYFQVVAAFPRAPGKLQRRLAERCAYADTAALNTAVEEFLLDHLGGHTVSYAEQWANSNGWRIVTAALPEGRRYVGMRAAQDIPYPRLFPAMISFPHELLSDILWIEPGPCAGAWSARLSLDDAERVQRVAFQLELHECYV